MENPIFQIAIVVNFSSDMTGGDMTVFAEQLKKVVDEALAMVPEHETYFPKSKNGERVFVDDRYDDGGPVE